MVREYFYSPEANGLFILPGFQINSKLALAFQT